MTHAPVGGSRSLSADDATARLIAQWLHGRSLNTEDAYHRDVARFLAFASAPLDRVTLSDLQAWADQLDRDGLATASRARALSAIKSLLAFGHRLGLLPVNVGAALRSPPYRRRLDVRLMSHPGIHSNEGFAESEREPYISGTSTSGGRQRLTANRRGLLVSISRLNGDEDGPPRTRKNRGATC
jgi:Phage integrase, N-terminal SAM-like domain